MSACELKQSDRKVIDNLIHKLLQTQLEIGFD